MAIDLHWLDLTAQRRRPARGMALVLALLLVWMALWGAWHHIAHAPKALATSQWVLAGDATDADHAPGTDTCRLLDQASLADRLLASAPALVVVQAALARPQAVGLTAAASAATWRLKARGPP